MVEKIRNKANHNSDVIVINVPTESNFDKADEDVAEEVVVDLNNISPGTLFDTMDEAAVGFAHYINKRSIEENLEYASFIYSLKAFEDEHITISNPGYNGNSLTSRFWNLLFDGKESKTFTVIKLVTKYSYVKPKSGTSREVDIPINWFWIYNKEAEIHTHAKYLAKDSDQFSIYDYNNWINYLVTPAGTVLKYDPKYDDPDDEGHVIHWSAPYDPNHPDK